MPTYSASIKLNPMLPWSDIEDAGLTEVEQHGRASMEEG